MQYSRRLRNWYRIRRLFLLTNAWAFFIGLLCFFSGLAYLLHPELAVGSAIDAALSHSFLFFVWNLFYCIGGLGIVVGLLRLDDATEVSGLVFLSGAIFINLLAILLFRGAGPALATAPVLIGFALAAFIRVRILLGRVK